MNEQAGFAGAIVIEVSECRLTETGLEWLDADGQTHALAFHEIAELAARSERVNGLARRAQILVVTRDGRRLLFVQTGGPLSALPGAGPTLARLAEDFGRRVAAANPGALVRLGLGGMGAVLYLAFALFILAVLVALFILVLFVGLIWVAIAVALFALLALPRAIARLFRRGGSDRRRLR